MLISSFAFSISKFCWKILKFCEVEKVGRAWSKFYPSEFSKAIESGVISGASLKLAFLCFPPVPHELFL